MFTKRKLVWLIAFIALVFAVNKAFSLADTLSPGTLIFSAPGLFSFGRSSSFNGQVTLSMHADARSMQSQLPLRKLEDARAVEAAGMSLKKHRAINPSGKVSCLISDAGVQYLLGFFELERADAWARPFLAQQDAADLQTVETHVRAWSADAQRAFNDCGLLFSERAEHCNKQFTALAFTFYEQLFAPSALYHMALRGIAPSEALYAFHSGREESSGFGTFRDLWATRRYRELSCNVQVLVQKHAIVAVARANNDYVETPADGDGMLAFYQKSAALREAFWAKEKQEQQSEETKNTFASALQPEPDLPEEPDGEDEIDNEDVEISEESYRTNKKHFEQQSTKGLLKSKKAHQEIIKEHVEKLKAYQKNPDAQDNRGLLRNAETVDKRNAIFNGRKNELKSQIRSQRMRLRVICDILKDRGVV